MAQIVWFLILSLLASGGVAGGFVLLMREVERTAIGGIDRLQTEGQISAALERAHEAGIDPRTIKKRALDFSAIMLRPL